MNEELKKKMDELADKYLNEVLPVVYKAMDEAKISYSEDQLENMASDAFHAGFSAAVEEMEKMNQGAREFWVLEDELKFGSLVSSDPRDHATQTVLFRIPICTDMPELAIRLREVKND